MKQKQPARVGRRLAAIVAADVAGYSRLMGLDEVGNARPHSANTARLPTPCGETRRSPREDHGGRRVA